MNIYDIAKLAGVSIATVSRVVNGSEKVSAKTRDKVLSVINDAGYTPNVFAQGLGLNTMHTVGIMIPDISDAYMASAMSFLEESLNLAGYECILACSGYSMEQKTERLNMLLSKKIDAVILVGSTYAGSGDDTHETDYIREAAKSVPVFVINGFIEGENIFCTVNNDLNATYSVVTELINSGRKRILFMSNSHSYSARQKLAGYEKALRDAGMPILGELKIHTKNRIHYVRDMLLSYRTLQFDAVITTDDAMAVGAVKFAAMSGLKIPEDIEIVGYNDSNLCVACEPELTSIDNRVSQVCHDTVDALVGILRNKKKPEKNLVIECRLEKRSTTDF